ncbi:MAG: N-acetylneuraminate synthase [Candidatus Aenigmatarchaeota archaeon]|nr:MAG: N-acetylneuraminate synthase [Candidatus Aenigmarchaeota archaeon]
MKIGKCDLNKSVYVIAEVGGNHGGDFNLAKKYVREAAKAGVNAVKFQMYRGRRLVTRVMEPLPMVSGKYKSQLERFEELEFSNDEFVELAGYAKKKGVDYCASVWDEEMAELLYEIGDFFKIGSGDLTNLPLLRYIIKKGKPILLSTGFARIEEIERVLSEIPKERLVLLHCVGSYPCPLEDANLSTIPFLRERFGVMVGYSDHTIGTLASKVAVLLGARVIEKHFTLDKNNPIGDHRLSADPKEMKEIVDDIKKIERMMGTVKTGPLSSELKIKRMMRRSLAAKVDIPKGSILTHDILTSLRPEDGISPLFVDEVVGKKVLRDIKEGEIIYYEDIHGFPQRRSK